MHPAANAKSSRLRVSVDERTKRAAHNYGERDPLRGSAKDPKQSSKRAYQ
jgi:hypothetical protein